MNKKLIPILIIILLLGGIFYFTNRKKFPDVNDQTRVVFYYGETCPHCVNVERFMKDKGVESKYGVVKKEIYKNAANKEEMAKRAAICGLDPANLVVPFLWNGNGCNLGEDSIIKYFKTKLDEK